MSNDPYHRGMTERPKRRYRRAEASREHILDVCEPLFYAEGIHAVGVDRIAAAAEVTTTTLYRIFRSKDALVAEYLRRKDTEWFEWLVAAGAGGLPSCFDELDTEVRDAGYRGCPFRMALAEYPSPASEVHRVAIDNKRRTLEHFADEASKAGCSDPQTVAAQLVLIVDGICASGAERSPSSPAGSGPALARRILSEATAG